MFQTLQFLAFSMPKHDVERIEIRLSKQVIALRIESDRLFTFDGTLLVYRIFCERQIGSPRFSAHP